MRRGSNVNGVWVEEYNSETGTYTRRDTTGQVIFQRPLTEEEVADFARAATEASASRPAAWFTATIDVGPTPTRQAHGTFPHPGIAVGTRMMALLSPIYPESRDPDEWEMADVGARLLVVEPGVVAYVLTGRDGNLSGQYNINYITNG